jgi:hypothetical protein
MCIVQRAASGVACAISAYVNIHNIMIYAYIIEIKKQKQKQKQNAKIYKSANFAKHLAEAKCDHLGRNIPLKGNQQ